MKAWRAAAALSMLLSGPILGAERGAPDQLPPVAEILGDRLWPLTAVGDDELRDSVAERPSFSAELAALRSGVPRRQCAAIQRLSEARAPFSAAYLAALLLLADTPPKVRIEAASGLGRIGFAGSAAALRVGLYDPDERVRFASALALGRLESAETSFALGQALIRDDHWWVRYAAAVSLGNARRPESVPVLARALRHDLLWQVRQQAARSLGEIGGPDAVAELMGALADKDSAVRYAAARGLAETVPPESFDDLLALYEAERDPLTRNQLRRALARAGR